MMLVLRTHSQSFEGRSASLLAMAVIALVVAAVALVGLLPALHAHSHVDHASFLLSGEARELPSPPCGHRCSGHGAHEPSRLASLAASHGDANESREGKSDHAPEVPEHDCGVCLQLALVKSGLALLGVADLALREGRANLPEAEVRPLPVSVRPARIFRERGPPRLV